MKQFGKNRRHQKEGTRPQSAARYPEFLAGVAGTYTVVASKGREFLFQIHLQWESKEGKHVAIVREPSPLCGTARPVFFRHELLVAEEGNYSLTAGRIGEIQAAMIETIRSAMPSEIACLKAYRGEQARKSAIEHSSNVFVLDDQRHQAEEQLIAAAG